MIINDPRNGNAAYVNADNRIITKAITVPEVLDAASSGRAYNIVTSQIALTSSSDSALMFFKNDESHDLVLESFVVGINNLGTHVGSPFVTVVRNPTGSSFTTAAAHSQNRDFSSSKALASTSLAYEGAEAATLTGGNTIGTFQMSAGSRLFATVNFVLGRGNTIGFKLNPKVTAGTASVYVALICYVKGDE